MKCRALKGVHGVGAVPWGRRAHTEGILFLWGCVSALSQLLWWWGSSLLTSHPTSAQICEAELFSLRLRDQWGEVGGPNQAIETQFWDFYCNCWERGHFSLMPHSPCPLWWLPRGLDASLDLLVVNLNPQREESVEEKGTWRYTGFWCSLIESLGPVMPAARTCQTFLSYEPMKLIVCPCHFEWVFCLL